MRLKILIVFLQISSFCLLPIYGSGDAASDRLYNSLENEKISRRNWFEKTGNINEWMTHHPGQQTIQDLANEKESAKEMTKILLKEADLNILDQDFQFLFKNTTAFGKLSTNHGLKFVKLHHAGEGKKEAEGARFLSPFFPVIQAEGVITSPLFELLVFPFHSSISQEKGMLFDLIYLDFPEAEKITRKMFQDMLVVVNQTLDFSAESSPNDRLYFNRLKTIAEEGEEGRIEKYYSHSALMGFPWEVLEQAHFCVDGIEYEETLHELLSNAKKVLDPKQKRFMATSHGDWHDMNICISPENSYVFLDCEMSGKNGVIEDAIVYLVFNSVQGDYLGVKYYPSHFFMRESSLRLAKMQMVNHFAKAKIIHRRGQICLREIGKFGTCLERKKIARIFIDEYLTKVLMEIRSRWGEERFQLQEERIKSCILLRLLGLYNIANMEREDQAKVLGFIFKVLATPKNHIDRRTTLQKFYDNL